MTVKMTLSFTDRYHRFLFEKVGDGIYASQSAAVEQMIHDEEERDIALGALAEEVRARLATPRFPFVEHDDALAAARATVAAARKA